LGTKKRPFEGKGVFYPSHFPGICPGYFLGYSGEVNPHVFGFPSASLIYFSRRRAVNVESDKYALAARRDWLTKLKKGCNFFTLSTD
jgi:hypothetical protein